MWNCNWGYPYGIGSWFHDHGFFGILLSIIMMIVIIYFIIFIVRLFLGKDNVPSDQNDSIRILKSKYAAGAISEAEYIRMRDILTS